MQPNLKGKRMQNNHEEYTAACKEVWETLSKIDCSEHVEQKNGLTYLSWGWAWQMLMNNYPNSSFVFDPVTFYANGTAEASVTLGIVNKGHVIKRQMWLPVLDYRNKPVVDPDSMAINTCKMRCLTKAIAMAGLGMYIYCGEDLPQEVGVPVAPAEAPALNTPPMPAPAPAPVTAPPQDDAPNIADEKGAADIAGIICKMVTMHSGSMEQLVGFWNDNKAVIDTLDSKWPAQFALVKAAFTEARSIVNQGETS